ncbi:polyprenyl synthetase family protein [Thioalkalivibrio sp. HK1]|uniref:polyprenyl synthetase family protein n=1 Tax=Thioalkalivibrio sp. HK1 TaxID=1469245 RepID=UPI0004B109A4|nr:farnesyl diphosphate synthase [Thioalkalivibrio sp. HK1]
MSASASSTTHPSLPSSASDDATFERSLSDERKRIHTLLDRALPAPDLIPQELHRAMRHSVLNGGKRLRAILVLAVADAIKGRSKKSDDAACAVELVHAYSLVHDDLPSMDDDDLRRGVPTCHRVFGEANALLAGDTLQSLAFEVLAREEHPANGEMVRTLARAIGSTGMGGGQAIDLAAVEKTMRLSDLEDMHERKTGALIRACVRLGALSVGIVDNIGGEGSKILAALDRYARCTGLAFQIRDDVLDIEGDTDTLGKHRGMDVALNKPTYPALIGIDASRAKAHELHDRALAEIESWGPAFDSLRRIAGFIVNRRY